MAIMKSHTLLENVPSESSKQQDCSRAPPRVIEETINDFVGVLSRFREEQIALCHMSKRCFNHFEFVLATVTPLGSIDDGNLDSQPEEYQIQSPFIWRSFLAQLR